MGRNAMGREHRVEKAGIPAGTVDMMLLKALSWGDIHGYGVAQRVRQATEGVLEIEEGSLYPALQRLLEKGWATAEWRLSDTGRRARYYKLTRTGRKRLEERVAEYRRVNRAIGKLLAAEEA
jgi:PadR family transcriptional regulator PadR